MTKDLRRQVLEHLDKAEALLSDQGDSVERDALNDVRGWVAIGYRQVKRHQPEQCDREFEYEVHYTIRKWPVDAAEMEAFFDAIIADDGK